MEGATGEREERIWRAERAPDGREQKGEGATLESEQERLTLPGRGGRRRAGGREGGRGVRGQARGEGSITRRPRSAGAVSGALVCSQCEEEPSILSD